MLALGSYLFGFMTCYVPVGTICLPATNVVKDAEQMLESAAEAEKEGGMILPFERTKDPREYIPGHSTDSIHLLPSLLVTL